MKRLFCMFITILLVMSNILFATNVAYADDSIVIEELGISVSSKNVKYHEMDDDGFYYLYTMDGGTGNHGIPYVIIGRYDYLTMDNFYEAFTNMMLDNYTDLSVVEEPTDVTIGKYDLKEFKYNYSVGNYTILDTRMFMEYNGFVYMFGSKEIPSDSMTVGKVLFTTVKSLKFLDGKNEESKKHKKSDKKNSITSGSLFDVVSDEPAGGRIVEVTDGDSGLTMARCFVPNDYTVELNTGVGGNGVISPVLLLISATRKDNGATFFYATQRTFADDSSYLNGQEYFDDEGTFSYDQMAVTLRTRDASEFCEYFKTEYMQSGVQFELVETRETTKGMAESAAAFKKEMESSGVTLDSVSCSMCEKIYKVSIKDVKTVANNSSEARDYYLYIGTAVRGYQFSSGSSGWGMSLGTIRRTWGPLATFAALIPVDEWDSVYPEFQQFMSNTAVTNGFLKMQESIGLAMVAIQAGAEADRLDQQIEDAKKTYLKDDSYDLTDAYSDYIFDQNDYITSDGDHIKMSTQYDYVYEDQYGNVYGSNTALNNGWTQLEPSTVGR